MPPTQLLLFALFIIVAQFVSAFSRSIHKPSVLFVDPPPPDATVTRRNGTVLPPYDTVYYFDQLIDHGNPGLGTFKQRYWHTYEFYEPGGPVILSTPGETNANYFQSYLTNLTINGLIAQQENGTTILLEHRFYGLSNPYPNLSVRSLGFHTIQQAIDDLVYFAQKVVLPMPGGNQLTPDKVPWVLVGGSYAGALTSWTMVNKPGIFWAGYSSSGVVQAIENYWAYFEPIRQYMPQNCSADVQAVIAHIDQVFTSTNQSGIDSITATFGLSDLTHPDDVVNALKVDLNQWQRLQPSNGPGAPFYVFCDALEVDLGANAPESGWGVDHALQAWGQFFKTTTIPNTCESESVADCFGSYDPTQAYWTNITIDNQDRSWFWIVCNELGFYQEAAPENQPTLVSRLLQPNYDERQCELMFPEAFSSPPVPQVAAINTLYQGWNVQTDRLFFANGRRDPWRAATVSAVGVNKTSTASQPIALGEGFHCSDLKTLSGQLDPSIAEVQNAALASMHAWLAAWTPHQPGTRQTSNALTTRRLPVYSTLKGALDSWRKRARSP